MLIRAHLVACSPRQSSDEGRGDGVHSGRVYLCQGIDETEPDLFTHILLHELVHFADDESQERGIGDHGYRELALRLPHALRTRNSDNFALFASHVHFGRDRLIASQPTLRPHGRQPSSEESTMAIALFSFGHGETQWHRCFKCKCLFWAGAAGGKCPFGMTHVVEADQEYILQFVESYSNSGFKNYQSNWRWCESCEALFFGGGTGGVCPTNQSAHHRSQQNYAVLHNSGFPGLPSQVNWKFCSKCACLVWITAGLAKCAAGGVHSVGQSGNYRLSVRLL